MTRTRTFFALLFLAACSKAPPAKGRPSDAGAPKAAATPVKPDASEVCAGDQKLAAEQAARAQEDQARKAADAALNDATQALLAQVSAILEHESNALVASPGRTGYKQAAAQWEAARKAYGAAYKVPPEKLEVKAPEVSAVNNAVGMTATCLSINADKPVQACDTGCVARVAVTRWLGRQMIGTKACAPADAEAGAKVYGKPPFAKLLVSVCQAAVGHDVAKCNGMADAEAKAVCRALAGGDAKECDGLPDAAKALCHDEIDLVAAASNGVLKAPAELRPDLAVLVTALDGKADAAACRAAALDRFAKLLPPPEPAPAPAAPTQAPAPAKP